MRDSVYNPMIIEATIDVADFDAELAKLSLPSYSKVVHSDGKGGIIHIEADSAEQLAVRVYETIQRLDCYDLDPNAHFLFRVGNAGLRTEATDSLSRLREICGSLA